MNSSKRIKLFLAGLLILSGIISISAQDWSQWRGANRDGKVNGFIAPEDWPPELNIQWSESVGTGDATPVLVGDRLFLFTRQDDKEVILCLNAGNGAEQWRNEYVAPAVTGAGARHPGPRSTPAVSDGKMVTIGASGILSCLDASTGKLLWRKDPFPGVVPMFFTSMSPMIADGLCIAHLGGQGNGALIAYKMDSGNELWRWTEEEPDYGSPVLLTIEGKKMIVTLPKRALLGLLFLTGNSYGKFPLLRRAGLTMLPRPLLMGTP